MSLLIDLPETLEHKVKTEAKKRQRSPEELIADIVARSFENDFVPSVAEVVARIKRIPPNPAMVTPPQASLAEALRRSPPDPNFNLADWNKQWAAAEEELKRINLLNDIAEGLT